MMKETKLFQLVSRENKHEDSIVLVNGPHGPIKIGQGYCTIIAGPCAVESWEDYLEVALFLKQSGAHILRGGLFKPRTSPYSFRGLGKEGLEIMAEARRITGMPVISEIMDLRDLDSLYQQVDILQVGSRNMQNYVLLEQLGKIDKPIFLKRGLSATIEEWLLAAEYIVSGGNSQVILCERGIRTFENATRNTLDISAIAALKGMTHLPVIIDPSHATGIARLVAPMALAAVAAGADGLIIEVHNDPPRALCDGPQSLTPKAFEELAGAIEAIRPYAHNYGTPR